MSVNKVNLDGSLSRIAGGTLYVDSPVGTILAYGGETAPNGWLVCDGSILSRTKYSALFAIIGTSFGEGDGETTFGIPDLRECVPVGIGENNIATISNHDIYTLGEFKDDSLGNHTHPLTVTTRATFNNAGVPVGIGNNNAPTTATHGKQLGVNYIIKAKHTPIPTDFIDEVNDIIKDNARECHGFLINSLLGEISGFGRAIVTLKDGIAKIEFSAKIESNDMTDGFNWGLNADLLRNLMPDLPNITPISANSQLQYFAATGDVLIDLMGYSALAIPTGQFWTPARMYLPSGSVGSWGSINFPVNSYITGTVYGTYEV